MCRQLRMRQVREERVAETTPRSAADYRRGMKHQQQLRLRQGEEEEEERVACTYVTTRAWRVGRSCFQH